VDFFMSRDIDAWIIEREYFSVLEWLHSNTVFHIMRGFFNLICKRKRLQRKHPDSDNDVI